MKNNMNRRKFITTTALALPSVTLLGAISTQQKTYRSATSLYSNEEMTEWCNKNGVRYAKDDELGKKLAAEKRINDARLAKIAKRKAEQDAKLVREVAAAAEGEPENAPEAEDAVAGAVAEDQPQE